MAQTESEDGARNLAPRPAWCRIVRSAAFLLAIPAGIACCALMIQVVIDVLGRTFFNNPLGGTLEVTANWWMISIVFAAMGYTQLRGEHVRATTVIELMDSRWQRAAEILSLVVFVMLALLFATYSWHAALHALAIRETSNTAEWVLIWPFKFLLPLGFLSLALVCVTTIHDLMTNHKLPSASQDLV